MIKLQKKKADYNTVLGFYLTTKYYDDAVTGIRNVKKCLQRLKITRFSNNTGYSVNVLFL
jgi:hypothetical protein